MDLADLLDPQEVVDTARDKVSRVLTLTGWHLEETDGVLMASHQELAAQRASSEAELLRRCWRAEEVMAEQQRIARGGTT